MVQATKGRPRKELDLTEYKGRFANRMREVRKAKGITATALAEKFSEASGRLVMASTIYQYEGGDITPRIDDNLPLLAKCLGVKVGDLFPPR